MATEKIPRAFLAPSRSAFVVIDPVTDEYHRILDRGNAVQLPLSQSYFAVSYVWNDWKEQPDDKYPSWKLIRERLLQVGNTDLPLYVANASSSEIAKKLSLTTNKAEPLRCWLDSQCINQDLLADKAYWIPRMNGVYFDASCTVLLLRDLDLTALHEAFKLMSCLILENFGGAQHSSHRCLFTPSCISLRSSISTELEEACLQVLEALWSGPWRKRAWIFQEILLSAKYMLVWGDASSVAYMSLATVGRIAAFFYSIHPEMTWLHEFWTWCKQCHCLREFYSEKCDMEATLLQLAENLNSTLPCDKYYALCGILGLSDVKYDSQHSAEQALSNIISHLTKQGRMGWMYAVPPSISSSGISLSDTYMSPFVLTKKKRQFAVAKYQESFVSDRFMGFPAVDMGTVDQITSLGTILKQSGKRFGEVLSDGLNRRALDGLWANASAAEKRLPAMLFRLGYDTIHPFRERVLFKQLWSALRLDLSDWTLDSVEEQSSALWLMTTILLFIRADSFVTDDPMQEQLVRMAAGELQNLCKALVMQRWHAVFWSLKSEGDVLSSSMVSLAWIQDDVSARAWLGRSVWSIRTQHSTDSLMIIADSASSLIRHPDNDVKRRPADGSTQLSETDATFFGVTLLVPKLLPLLTSNNATFHDNPAEFYGDMFDRALASVTMAFTQLSTAISDSWNQKAKFLMIPRRKDVVRPSSEGEQDRNMRDLVGQFQDFYFLAQSKDSETDAGQSYALEELQSIFPSLDRELLADILRMHDHNSEKATETCLDMTADASTAPALPPATASPPATAPPSATVSMAPIAPTPRVDSLPLISFSFTGTPSSQVAANTNIDSWVQHIQPSILDTSVPLVSEPEKDVNAIASHAIDSARSRSNSNNPFRRHMTPKPH
ncbi:hypothetical protein CKM354_000425700 [Cercospora kikuchii]|uniref:CUE domain-containing protein n=1 Tax=Cercospora kikuchii TaxID=84275 RepID=A0A9P3FEG4_9PEZI|nr:uncharacterized protein CKM354_000425700 [Cercospora kikuchii]GIZ40937.1 hypothetical protein CKM354_000425700 [Cercospora kikuchii]